MQLMEVIGAQTVRIAALEEHIGKLSQENQQLKAELQGLTAGQVPAPGPVLVPDPAPASQ